MAAMLPRASDSTAITTSMLRQSAASPPSASPRMRMKNANAAIFGAELISRVTAVGAPW